MQKSDEVAAALRSYLEAIARGDVEAVEAMISRQADVILIGTDPAEWWTGFDAAVQAFRTQMAEWGGGPPIVVGEPQGYSNGDVGWAADRPKLALPDGDVPFRITTVFQREGGRWKVVQDHAFIGIANEEALGKELTI